ncbi:MAG: BrnA antitoxin family protein [Gemmataceae bacterium]|nr:BrnA antitoxin family protein [Gemmataceae bacterium]
MREKRLTDEELAREAQLWDNREATPADWDDAPDSVPRVAESEALSIRLPKKQLALLEEFARRQGISFQILIKRWLDDRIRAEYMQLSAATSTAKGTSAS